MDCEDSSMEFFFPGASSISEAHRLHRALADSLVEMTGWAITPVKVYAVRYRAQEREFLAQVGIIHPPFPDEAPVRAIFHTPAAFLICTSLHGYGSTLPIIISRAAVSDVEYFNGIHDPVAIR